MRRLARGMGPRNGRPILDHADAHGVDVCYEIHLGEDLHDGVTFEMFLERLGSGRMGVLFETPRGRCARGCAIRERPYHSCH